MTDQPSTGSLVRGILLVSAYTAFCVFFMAYPDAGVPVTTVGPLSVTYYDMLLTASLMAGGLPLVRYAVLSDRPVVRRVTRLVVLYLAYELLVVIPVGVWMMPSGLSLIVRTMGVRFTWLLLPSIVMLCGNSRAQRVAGLVPAVAAMGLAVWGMYVLATGGAGFYVEGGDVRFRVLWGGTTLLFLWAFLLGSSGLVSRRFGLILVTAGLVGLALTNHRSGMIAFAVAGLLMVVWSGRLSKFIILSIPLGFSILAIGIAWGHDLQGVFSYTFTKLLDVTAGNGADRVQRWGLAWSFFLDRPFNDFVWSWRYYLADLARPYAPHNFALEIAVSEGIAGLVFYSALVGGVIRSAWMHIRADGQVRLLVSYVVGYFAFCVANTNMYSLASMPLLVCALGALAQRIDAVRWMKLEAFDLDAKPASV